MSSPRSNPRQAVSRRRFTNNLAVVVGSTLVVLGPGETKADGEGGVVGSVKESGVTERLVKHDT